MLAALRERVGDWDADAERMLLNKARRELKASKKEFSDASDEDLLLACRTFLAEDRLHVSMLSAH